MHVEHSETVDAEPINIMFVINRNVNKMQK